MVSSGGGDSPLLIHASLSLLLLRHFFRGEGAAGLALPIRWKAESLHLPFVRRALKNLLVVQTLSDVAHVNYCCVPPSTVYPCALPGEWWQMLSSASPGLEVRALAREIALLESGCGAGLPKRHKVEECKVCEQCPSNASWSVFGLGWLVMRRHDGEKANAQLTFMERQARLMLKYT